MSYLLDPIFKKHLLDSGVPEDHIIKIELDRVANRKYHHNPEAFDQYIRHFIHDKEMYYLLLDEYSLLMDLNSS